MGRILAAAQRASTPEQALIPVLAGLDRLETSGLPTDRYVGRMVECISKGAPGERLKARAEGFVEDTSAARVLVDGLEAAGADGEWRGLRVERHRGPRRYPGHGEDHRGRPVGRAESHEDGPPPPRPLGRRGPGPPPGPARGGQGRLHGAPSRSRTPCPTRKSVASPPPSSWGDGAAWPTPMCSRPSSGRSPPEPSLRRSCGSGRPTRACADRGWGEAGDAAARVAPGAAGGRDRGPAKATKAAKVDRAAGVPGAAGASRIVDRRLF